MPLSLLVAPPRHRPTPSPPPPVGPGPRRRRPVLAALALLAAGCSSGASAAALGEEATAASEVRVRQVAVGRGPVARPVRAGGLLRHKNEVDLSFKVGGIIAAMAVEEGALVRKGQVLARLDTTEVAAGVSQARQGAERAERDLARARHLGATGAVAISEEQNAETGAAVARAVLAAQEFNARHAVIVAPDDGFIDRRMAAVGEVVAAGRPVFHLSGRSRGAVVRLGLVDRDALGLRVGAAAQVTLDARPDAPLPAHVSQIATVASPATGTYEVEVRLDSEPPGLLSGMTAKVVVEHQEAPAAHVPLASLVDGNGRSAAVYTVHEGKARRVPVTVAFLFGDRAALAGGIAGVDQVVTDGATALADGVAVRVVP